MPSDRMLTEQELERWESKIKDGAFCPMRPEEMLSVIAQARLAIHLDHLLSSEDLSIDLQNGLRVCDVSGDDNPWIVTEGRGIKGEFATAREAVMFALSREVVRDAD